MELLLRSPEIDKLYAAFVKFQGELGTATKNKKGQYAYADLAQIFETAAEALKANGLAIKQPILTHDDGEDYVHTQLIHVSGQYEQSWVKLFLSSKSNISEHQQWGSGVTYLKRYCYQSLLGIATEDDDGASAKGKHRETGPDNTPLTAEQYKQILETIGNDHAIKADIEKQIAKRDITSLDKIPKRLFTQCLARIQELKDRKHDDH